MSLSLADVESLMINNGLTPTNTNVHIWDASDTEILVESRLVGFGPTYLDVSPVGGGAGATRIAFLSEPQLFRRALIGGSVADPPRQVLDLYYA